MGKQGSESSTISGAMMAETIHSRPAARETIYLAFALLPPITLVALLLWGVWEQITAAQYVEAEIASLKASSQPVDNVMLIAAQRDQASIAGARDWHDLNVAIEMLNHKYGEAFRMFDESEQLKPAGEDWSAKPIAELYSAEAAPLIERIQTLLQRDRPLPDAMIHSNSLSLFSHFFGIGRGHDLLLREFRLAYHNENPDRSAELVELYIASDQAACDGLMTGPLYFALDRSLEHDFWTSEALSQVWLSLRDYNPRRTSWADQVNARRVDLLTQARMSEFHDGINPRLNDDTPYKIAATHVARYLQFYDELEKLPGYGSREHYWAVEDVIAKMNEARAEIAFESMVAVPIATVDSFGSLHYGSNWSSNTLMSRMHERRLRTAIAIKQFQLQEHRWPASLAELTRVGLAASDWKMIGDIDFGYRVDQDGQTARLWRAERLGDPDGREILKNWQWPGELPSEMVLSKENIQAAETAIR
jgi:hypothetical protein